MPDRLDRESDAQLLRLLADGELAEAQTPRVQAMLEGHEPSADAARRMVRGEQSLRKAVGVTMGAASAPVWLRAQIADAMANASVVAGDSGAHEPANRGHAIADGLERGGAATPVRRRSPLWRLIASPQHANMAAVAAVLILIGGAVLFGIFGRTIDDVPVSRPVDVVGNVAQYVDGEHTQCTTNLQHILDESTWHTPSEAEAGMSELLSAPVMAFDLSEVGYDFIGAGRCDVPLDAQPSGHLMYRKMVNGKPGPMVSVFLASAEGCCKNICAGLQVGEWMVARKPSCKRPVLFSTDGRLVYFLVCCDERDAAKVGKTITLALAPGSR